MAVNSGSWTTGLFDCCQDPYTCWCALCCPCVLVGRTANIVNQGTISSCYGGVVFCMLQAFGGFGCLYSYLNRSKLRQKFQLPAVGACDDFCVEWCCNCCSVAQAYRELENRKIDPAQGYEAVKSIYERPPFVPRMFKL